MRRRAAAGDEPAVEEWDAGWVRTPSTGAAANAARIARLAGWVLLLSGPVLGGTALAMVQSGDAGRDAPGPAAAGDQAGPAGFADLYVDAYLTGGSGRLLAAYYPPAGGMALPGISEGQQAVSTGTVRLRQVSAGYWSATVAVRLEPRGGPATAAGTRYFQVPVRVSGSGYVASALPGEVAGPAIGSAPALAYRPVAASGTPLAGTLSSFFTAYLAGGGGLAAQTSPGAALSPVTPAPYSQVELTRVAAAGEAGEAAPAEGTRLQVLADVEANAPDGTWPLTYAIDLTARAGRWEVSGIAPAPLVAASSSSGVQ